MKYPVAEKFKAPQGEGLYTGTPMAFIRLVGCSVGKGVCTHCDTDFDKVHPQRGGGLFEPEELRDWVGPFKHVCLTGGEPLDRDIRPLDEAMKDAEMFHIETSGTKCPPWFLNFAGGTGVWTTVSPKPGYDEFMIRLADEIKVILFGLGDGEGWPSLQDAIKWADEGKLVYLQARNDKYYPSNVATDEVIKAVLSHPQLRLSAQLHKYLRTR